MVNPAKVTDHHAILPTKQAMKAEWTGLSEKKRSLLYLTSMQVLKAVAEDFQYEQAEITVTCAGHEFYAKGKRTEQMGYKEVEAAFRKKYQQGQKKRMKRKKEYSRISEKRSCVPGDTGSM